MAETESTPTPGPDLECRGPSAPPRACGPEVISCALDRFFSCSPSFIWEPITLAAVEVLDQAAPAPATKPAGDGKIAPTPPTAPPAGATGTGPRRRARRDTPAAPRSAWSSQTWSGLRFRSIGPALTSGRIQDLAVDPTKPSRWYVASASGGVWKTENAGTSWTPIFDSEGSYSIGCITLDPSNHFTVWVGTGENKTQRSVGYGDGVYRSDDGGRNWKNMGLKTSEHIAGFVVHPKDSNVVFVARRARSGRRAASAASTRRPMAAERGARC